MKGVGEQGRRGGSGEGGCRGRVQRRSPFTGPSEAEAASCTSLRFSPPGLPNADLMKDGIMNHFLLLPSCCQELL